MENNTPPKTERKARKRLTQSEKEAIIEDIKSGQYTNAQLAEKYEVSLPTIMNVKKQAGLTRGSANATAVSSAKTIDTPHTQKQLDQAVLKLVYEYVKVLKTDHDVVEVVTKIKVGSKSYDFEGLVSAAKEKAEEEVRNKRIAELEAELAALKGK